MSALARSPPAVSDTPAAFERGRPTASAKLVGAHARLDRADRDQERDRDRGATHLMTAPPRRA